jgi:hypothetical protein
MRASSRNRMDYLLTGELMTSIFII